jgi:hypothetical protein
MEDVELQKITFYRSMKDNFWRWAIKALVVHAVKFITIG